MWKILGVFLAHRAPLYDVRAGTSVDRRGIVPLTLGEGAGSRTRLGGQILRNAAALSCLMCSPVTVNNIRANRSTPGLRPQHLGGLELIRDLCGGRLDGGRVGSTEVTLKPGTIKGGSYLADTKTAGSVCLLLQAALPCLLFADSQSELVLRGGTNAEFAPQIDYFTWVFKPIAEKFGIHLDFDIVRRGYFPKGGGEVRLTIQPIKHLKPIDLTDAGDIVNITGRAFTAGSLPIKISHAMASEAEKLIKKQYPAVPINIEAIKEDQHKAVGNGTGIMLMAETSTGNLLGGSALGKRGISAEDVGKLAAKQLLSHLSTAASVDEFLQDQLIIFMALAVGRSRVRCGPISLHTQTSIEISKMLTEAKFEIEQVTEDQNIIQCDGIGLKNKNFS